MYQVTSDPKLFLRTPKSFTSAGTITTGDTAVTAMSGTHVKRSWYNLHHMCNPSLLRLRRIINSPVTDFLTATTRGIADIHKLSIQNPLSINPNPANGRIRAMMSTSGGTDIRDTMGIDTTIGRGLSRNSRLITPTMVEVTNRNSNSIVNNRTLTLLAQAA
ncbi:hypothetical protein PTI98_012588 [Pleurotus ostreatus]|nr:hypothetical protein PTI98_012588 [Pleurotus ostreatus]